MKRNPVNVYREIASVLASYGFGHIYRTRVRTKHKEQDARNLRLAFEELGPSFMKIGQRKSPHVRICRLRITYRKRQNSEMMLRQF
ncbi:MAG: hypothetical protein U5K84_04060 [Alkalibacterium sp.]|nr:hypothetical protein [Alkalibacterium sp.]